MAKKGVFKITGNHSPKTGEKTLYKVTDWYPATPSSQRKESLVTWELFRKRDDGKFTTTNIRKKGIGEFTFGKDAYKYIYQIEGYLHSSEGHEPMAMIVKPQKNEQQLAPKEKDILGVKLTYQDGSPVNKKLSYMDRLRATAKCQALEGEYITFSVWEDDEEKSGHHKNNQFIIKSSPVQVDSKGYARWNFTLLNTYISLANKREDDKKQHEYYVTAEYNGKPEASGNVNVNNPEYKVPASTPKNPNGASVPEKTKPKPAKSKQQPKPDTPKGSTNSGSQNNQPDKKGIIKSIKLVDKNGKAFTKKPKFGEDIKLIIEAKDVVGKKYTLKLWEHDNTGDNDLVYTNTHTFKADRQEVVISLNQEMQKIGETGKEPKNPDTGEYWTGNWQEIFAEVIFLNISTKSSTIDVGVKEVPKKQDNGKSPAKKEKKPQNGEESVCVCKDEYKLIWGNKLTCSQRKKVVEVCKNIFGEENKIDKANELMAIMHLETVTTFSPSKKGVSKTGTKFIGLIQFSEATAKKIGTTYDALGKMTFIQQMDYVEKYLKVNKDKMNTIVDFYLQVLKPSAVGNGGNRDYIVFDESISVPDGDGSKSTNEQRLKNIQNEPWVTKYGYASNPTFMLEKGEKIKRKRWVYSRQVYEDRYGEAGGKTYIWEIDKVVKDEHFKPGEKERYIGICEDKPEKKEELNGKYPPWVEIALEEEQKIIRENTHCQYIIDNYHNSTSNARMKRCGSEKDATRANAAWCGAFVAYCIKTSGYKFQPDPGAKWHGIENLVKRDSKGAPYETQEKWGKKHDKMYIGGIVEWHNDGHTTIILGIDKSNSKNYILLGGNQDNGVRFWTAPISKVKAYCIFPADYTGDLIPLKSIEPDDMSSGAVKYSEGSTS
ncbi:hypothetical protein [Chryseobacterium sp. OSA05B]|uniref:hypothetical protein n=1 Tax=Chryseobacterium sp. OSA05B TaxID=2862650 RepID=UPI001CBD0B1E|nr:hypothetical protein [Chryseobacterium sp. OSA05B]